jgi:hypothetical protein
MGPEEIERVISAITEKDVMSFAQRKCVKMSQANPFYANSFGV